jgi:PKD repeat protein
VSISAGGNTAIVGGNGDSSGAGAIWFFARTGGAWSQQGSKLVGTGAAGTASRGWSAALSADATTAVVGGYTDNANIGATWVFSGCLWSAVPVADLSYLPASPQAGQAVTLTDQSSNGPTAWLWDFGDGASSGAAPLTASSVTHTYASSGTYTVSMIAANCTGSNADVELGGLGILRRQITVSPPCTGAAISAQPQSQTIPWGRTAGLSVTATGTAPLACQWYRGASGDTSTKVGPNSNGFTTPSLTTTTSYWVLVTNACGTANSNTATITVTPQRARRAEVHPCTQPTITEHPHDWTISGGLTATLAVTASSSAALSYQWYQGTTGDTAHPVGSNSSSFTTPALVASTSYWVRVSNPCGWADSATAAVAILPYGTWGEVHSPNLTPAQTRAVAVRNGYLYLFSRTGKLETYDIRSLPGSQLGVSYSSPLSSLTLGSEGSDLVEFGDYVYAVGCCQGLSVLNAADPASLQQVGPVGPFAWGLSSTVAGSSLYVGAKRSVLVYSLTNPAAPALQGSFDLGDNWAYSVAAQGNLIYIGQLGIDSGYHLHPETDGLRILDSTDPAHIVEVAFTPGECPYHLRLVGGNLVAATDNHLVLYDLSTPIAPQVLNTRDANGRVVAVRGADTLLNGVAIRVGPSALSLLCYFNTLAGDQFDGSPYGSDVDGDFAFLAQSSRILIVRAFGPGTGTSD